MDSIAETDSRVFDEIAPGWYGYRHRTIFRAELEGLARRWQKGRLLNVGCGHGPDFLPFREGFGLHGLDFSPEMLRYARKYAQKFNFQPDLVLADAVHLPYRDNSFDWVIAVAAYHHLREGSSRRAALVELRRVLRPGGEAFITVWNRGQPRFWFRPREVLMPWRQKDKTLYRYYYLFTYSGLEKLVREAGFIILKSFPESRYRFPLKHFSRNICLLLKKPLPGRFTMAVR